MRVLLLAGTGEAHALAAGLIEQGHSVIASLSGVTRTPRDLSVETRVGGFGGDDGFREWLAQNPVDLVVDATHPFAQNISARTARICVDEQIVNLQVIREEWRATDCDNWIYIDKSEQSARHIEPGSQVFLATGRQTLHEFECLASSHLTCRQIDPPAEAFPFPNGQFLVGRPPFSIEDEVALFERLKIDWLVVKNAGGEMSRSKLDAARQLGLRVLMINRPTPPDGPKVATVKVALEWIDAYNNG